MDVQKEREAFEKAFAQTEFYKNKADLYSLLADIDDETFDFFRKNGFGDYSIGEAQAAWSAWQAAKAQAVPKWISVKDKLPKEKQWVLIRVTCSDYFNVEQGMYRGDGKWMNCWCANRHNDLYPVTHWMPLPESPQEPTND